MFPIFSAISRAPNAAARTLFGKGSQDGAFLRGMEDDRVTPVVLIGKKCLALPGHTTIERSVQAAEALAGFAHLGITNAANEQVFRVERIDRNDTNAGRHTAPF